MSKNMVAITQPDFFPWLGSIEKITGVDSFIFLDHVTNRPNDGIWTKRVKIIVNGEAQWIAVPLKKDKSREFVPINEMVIDQQKSFFNIQKTIQLNYSKHPFFADVFPLVEGFFTHASELIVERNIFFIKSLLERMNLSRPLLRSSEMKSTGINNELLIDLVKEVNGTDYLYGAGSVDYLDAELWKSNGIQLVAQEYSHPVYQQLRTKEFVPGLSIIDCLMNCGYEGTAALLRKSKN